MNIDWMPGAIGAFVRKEGSRVLQVLSATRDDNCVLVGMPGFVGQRADGSGEYHVFTEYWQWAPRVPEWNGEGLPPAGIPCEYYWASDDSWRKGTCVAHFDGRAVICDRDDEDCAERLDAHHVRPIRTPEQIAAEEREKAIEEIQGTVFLTCGTVLAQYVVEALVDAGYRKQVTP